MLKKSLPSPSLLKIFSVFYSENFIYLSHTDRSTVHLDLIIMWGLRLGVNTVFDTIAEHHLKTPCPHCTRVLSFSCMCGFVSAHRSVCSSLCPCCTVLITIAFSKVLIFSSLSLPFPPLFVFKIALPILGHLNFHINFRNRLSISTNIQLYFDAITFGLYCLLIFYLKRRIIKSSLGS